MSFRLTAGLTSSLITLLAYTRSETNIAKTLMPDEVAMGDYKQNRKRCGNSSRMSCISKTTMCEAHEMYQSESVKTVTGQAQIPDSERSGKTTRICNLSLQLSGFCPATPTP